MAQQNTVQMPGSFGGLMRYDAEYKSKFMMSPKVVIGFLVAILAVAFLLRVLYPVGV